MSKEYIEREAALKNIKETIIGASEFANDIRIAAMNAVSSAPTADVQEVRHGEWKTIIDPYGKIEGWLHEECGRQVTSKDDFCPHCGAKMDKE